MVHAAWPSSISVTSAAAQGASGREFMMAAINTGSASKGVEVDRRCGRLQLQHGENTRSTPTVGSHCGSNGRPGRLGLPSRRTAAASTT